MTEIKIELDGYEASPDYVDRMKDTVELLGITLGYMWDNVNITIKPAATE